MKNVFTKALCLFSAIVLLTGIQTWAQSSGKKALTDIAESEVVIKGERLTIAKHYRTLRLDKAEMVNLLSRAPMEPAETSRLANGATFEMPMPDGSYQRFLIYEYYVMHPDLAAKFPQIKTYTGQGVDDPSATIKLDITQFGFHAMVLSPKGSFFIDPYCKNNTTDYICYDKKDLQRTSSFICETPNTFNALDQASAGAGNKTSGTNLRTYRLALACTGEYAAFFGGTVSGAMAGMTTTMNRVNGVYETEVAIRMVMVANNNLLVYTSSSTDPYTNNNGGTMLGQNITTCNNVIGSSNYDIGHVFSTGGGGVAYLGVICTSNKGGGVTGSSSPTGDGYDIDYVAHEMGHQFGGNHTFNSQTGSCGGGNRAASAAYEPGSGITIMAYAGICGSDDLAPHSIAYFHVKSFDEIVNYSTTGNGNTCPVITSTGNTAPVITSVGASKSIPVSTPFVLTGAATDANGDALTYSWEEYDLGPAGAWNVQSTTAPMFRPFSPVSSSSRTFPKLSDIINNTTTVGELLPNQARTLKFHLTVRDNRTGGGGVMHPDTTLNIFVVNNGGAFAVTAPNTAVTWAGGSTQTITWNVSGTTSSPISCADVKISLSTDGGNTFPTVISATTANDGTESITVPNTATTTARIKVEAIGNIFFDMSNVNFTITASAGLTTVSTSAISPANYCAGASVNVPYTINAAANAGNVFTAQLSNSSGSFASPVAIGTLTTTAAGTIVASIPAGTATGTGYRIRVVSSAPVVTGSDNGSNLTISAQVAAAGIINTAFTSFCGGLPITFTTGSIANATTYTWGAPAGAVISSGQGTTTCVITFPSSGVTGAVTVSGSNANCTGTSSSLTVTANPVPATPTANNVSGCAGTPITLSGSPAGGSFSITNPYIGSSTIYTYTVTNGFGCTATSTPANVTVNPNPTTSVTGNTSFCSGSSTTLNAGAGFSSYNWSTGATTQTISASTAGTFIVTVTNANGCTGTALAITTVNSNPTTSITGSTSFCSGSSTALNAGAGFNSYNWSTGATTQTISASTAGIFTVTVTNANGCSGSVSATTIVNPLPTVSFSGLAGSYDVAASAVILTGSPSGGTFSGPGISGNTFTPSVAGVGGPYTINYSFTDGNGCSNNSSQQTTVTNCTAPAQPGTITATGGNTKVCPGDSKIYSIAAVSGATSYTWTPPTGGSIASGQGTISVTINYTAAFTASGMLSVVSNNACGSSIARTLTITRNTPSTPGTISGASGGVCAGTTGTYSVANVAGITYNWTAPANASILSGQGTNAVTIDFSALFTSGTLSVIANNGCGTSAARTLSILSKPATPSSITGASSAVCAGTSGTYSVTNVAGVTYNWTTPANASISNGQGTNVVTVDFSVLFTSGTLAVTATNPCGTSALRTKTISSVLGTPGTMTGPAYNNCNITSTYSIPAVAGATSYSWSTNVAGAVVTPSGTFASIAFPVFTSGTVSATANNTCGSSTARNLTVRGTPATPASITGPTAVCANQFGVPYFIAPISLATSYTWTGMTGSHISDGIVTSAGASLTTTSISVTVNFGSATGNLNVKANNACGTGSNKTLTVVFNCRDIINENSGQNFEIYIYPNPAHEQLNISFDSETSTAYSIQLIDLMGKIILQSNGVSVKGENNFQLTPDRIAKGMYFLKVTNGDKKNVSRVTIN